MLRISKEVKNFIKNTSTQFGKARLVLKDNRYFIEADQKIVIDFYEAQHNLQDCWLYNDDFMEDSKDEKLE